MLKLADSQLNHLGGVKRTVKVTNLFLRKVWPTGKYLLFLMVGETVLLCRQLQGLVKFLSKKLTMKLF